ncbi:MAG: hypothetical protein ACRDS0_24425 [Pseudonocardiaceae bacterium]
MASSTAARTGGQHGGQCEAAQAKDGQPGKGGDAGSQRDLRHRACHQQMLTNLHGYFSSYRG